MISSMQKEILLNKKLNKSFVTIKPEIYYMYVFIECVS